MENYVQIAGLILRLSGSEGTKKLDYLKKYLSFQESEPWFERLIFSE
jgi:hypothetical protein